MEHDFQVQHPVCFRTLDWSLVASRAMAETFTVSIGELNGRKRLKVATREINLEGEKGFFGFGPKHR